MSVWYYIDTSGQQRGPIQSSELASAFQSRQLLADTLVWRDGMPQWSPLQQCLQQLDLSSPPSLHAVVSDQPPSNPTSSCAQPLAPSATAWVITDDVVMAGFWRRFAAVMIDGLLMLALVLALLAVAVLLMGGIAALRPQPAETLNAGLVGMILPAIYLLPLILQFAYFSWMQAGTHQATFGKMAVGIKVCRTDGQAMTLDRSIGRWCVYFFLSLASCGITTVVSVFTIGLSARKQAVHDMIVDTLVVDRWAFSAHPERQQRQLGKVTIAVIALSAMLFLGYLALVIIGATLSSSQ